MANTIDSVFLKTLNGITELTIPKGANVLSGTSEPTSTQGSDGDIYFLYT